MVGVEEVSHGRTEGLVERTELQVVVQVVAGDL